MGRADGATPGPQTLGACAASEVTTFVGRADGVEVSVGVRPRPEPGAGHSAVVLDLGAPTQETAAGVRLGPEDAYRLAAAPSAAAFATAGRIRGAQFQTIRLRKVTRIRGRDSTRAETTG